MESETVTKCREIATAARARIGPVGNRYSAAQVALARTYDEYDFTSPEATAARDVLCKVWEEYEAAQAEFTIAWDKLRNAIKAEGGGDIDYWEY